MDYHNINELCDDLQFELKHIHDYSDYIVNGQNYALTFGTMKKTDVHQLDVNQKERNHISTFFSVPSVTYISGFQ